MTDLHRELLICIRPNSNNCHDPSAVTRLQIMGGEIEKRFCIPHVSLVESIPNDQTELGSMISDEHADEIMRNIHLIALQYVGCGCWIKSSRKYKR